MIALERAPVHAGIESLETRPATLRGQVALSGLGVATAATACARIARVLTNGIGNGVRKALDFALNDLPANPLHPPYQLPSRA